jgi:hypothetical protein
MVLGTKPRWLFPYAGWYQCWLIILLSKLTSSRWSRRSRLAIRKGAKFFTFHLLIGKGKNNSKSSTCFLIINIRCLKMKDLSLFCFPILTSNLSPSAYFLSRMGITRKLVYLTLIVCTMTSLHGTSMLIPLSLIPLMGLLSFSLPWWNQISMLLTLLLFLTLS